MTFRTFHKKTQAEAKISVDEKANCFEGAVYSTLIWLVLISSVGFYILSETSVCMPKQSWTFLCRFISAFLMHLQLLPGISKGLNMMKYVINHPNEFSEPKMAFLMGMLCFCSNTTSETFAVVYLGTVDHTINVII